MRAVDGSVLVGLLMCDDVGQPVYGTDSDRIATIVAMLLEHDRLVLQDPDVVRAALDDFRRAPAVGFRGLPGRGDRPQAGAPPRRDIRSCDVSNGRRRRSMSLRRKRARPPRPRTSPCYDDFTLRRGG